MSAEQGLLIEQLREQLRAAEAEIQHLKIELSGLGVRLSVYEGVDDALEGFSDG